MVYSNYRYVLFLSVLVMTKNRIFTCLRKLSIELDEGEHSLNDEREKREEYSREWNVTESKWRRGWLMRCTGDQCKPWRKARRSTVCYFEYLNISRTVWHWPLFFCCCCCYLLVHVLTGQFPPFLLVVSPNPSLPLFNFVRIDIAFLKKEFVRRSEEGGQFCSKRHGKIETRPLVKKKTDWHK